VIKPLYLELSVEELATFFLLQSEVITERQYTYLRFIMSISKCSLFICLYNIWTTNDKIKTQSPLFIFFSNIQIGLTAYVIEIYGDVREYLYVNI